MSDEIQKLTGHEKEQFIYCAAYSLLQSLYDKGITSIEVLERINLKNAEKMHCMPMEIKKKE